ncbi:MAG: DUF4390 domain-containing protein [Acidobacteria bacterium]|nr:DUF4390 domain-containing protein [Acidobacteriota bacterium]
MTSLRLLAIVLAAVALDAGTSGEVQVSTLVRDGRVYVSSTLTDGVIEELDEAIQSGLTTTFTYETELRRPVSIWFDRVLATATVSAAVQFDTLTGRYQLSRSVDGRIEDSKVSDDKAAVKRFVTAFERLPLFGTADLEPNVEYYVRVRVRTRPRVTWFFWPWDRGSATGFARFTFIP